MLAPFPIDPHLTGIAIAYQNEALIAESVLPTVGVGKQDFRWNKYSVKDGFTIPQTRVGRKSKPNQVEFGATEQSASTTDFALDAPVPNADLANADNRHDPRGYAALRATQLIELDRELRTAAKVFDATQYAAANKTTLAGVSQWSDTTSDPIGAIMDQALEATAVMMRPNVGLFGSEVWQKLRRHPKVIEAVKSTGGAITNGMVSKQAVADLFELEEILVGRSKQNTANIGQTETIARVWGKHALFFYRDRLTNNEGGISFGYSAQWGERIAGAIQDPDVGMRGGQRVRVGESRVEIIAAADVAFFFQNAVA